MKDVMEHEGIEDEGSESSPTETRLTVAEDDLRHIGVEVNAVYDTVSLCHKVMDDIADIVDDEEWSSVAFGLIGVLSALEGRMKALDAFVTDMGTENI